MIYPPFLRPGDTVGVTAPSAGIEPADHAAFDLSLSHLRRRGYTVRETAHVRAGGVVSAPADVRAAELNELLRDPSVRMVWCACGGDFLVEMLPHAALSAVADDPKWVQGYSDPTSLLYALTTVYDVATVYGVNAGGLDMHTLHPSLETNLRLLGGEVSPQHSFDKYQSRRIEGEGYALDTPVYWQTPNGPVNASGRLLGGCMECLLDIVGTRFDGTADFLRRYRDDGVIWYFDVFALTAEAVHNALWHLNQCGWFDTAAAVVFGRVGFPSTHVGLSYAEAITSALPHLPLVLEADVGHIPPRMTVVNGAPATLRAADGAGTLTMQWE